MTGKIWYDGDACEEHPIFHREQAEQLRNRLAPDRNREGPEEHRRDAERKIDLRERDLDGAEQRIGDDVGENDQHRGDQQGAWDVEDPFDLARAINLCAHRVPKQPWDQQGFGGDGDRRDREQMNGALCDAEKHRRKRQQQRLQDEKLQRGQHLAGGDDAKRSEQKQSAGQCIKGERATGEPFIVRPQISDSWVIMATTEITNAAPRNSVMRNSRSLASEDSI